MLRSGQTNSGSFRKGESREFYRNCVVCADRYISKSGSSKYCKECRMEKSICPECKNKKSIYHRFCGNSCAGKWKYRNSAKVRAVIKYGFNHPNRGIGISVANSGKPRLNMRGPLNPNWNGSITSSERHALMGRVEYKNWRKAVFDRDNYTCQICHQRGGRLNADHIIPYYINKHLALDIGNGRTLCLTCHKATPTWGHKVKTQYVMATK